jgi:Transposase DDE domain group 1
MQFILSETDDVLVSHTGLALAGALLRQTRLVPRLDALDVEGSKRPTLPHGEVLVSMIGLLCLGKSDYADIEAFRRETFFAQSLGLRGVPSEETLRQRLDQLGIAPVTVLHEESADLVRRHAPPLVPCHRSYLPLDVDVSPFDNSGTQKEGVAWTYKEHEGYAPVLAYLGQEGYLLACELRPGDQHVQKGTPEFLVRAVELARRVTDAQWLVRMDAGNDDAQNLRVLRKSHVAWIIQRNLRRESPSEWLEIAQAHGHCREPREGKEIYTGETALERAGRLQRVVFEVVHRTIDRDGQRLLVPDVEIATWWTSLSTREASPAEVIALYQQHGTSEQFHSELKSELDLERLPSGKFATNALMLALGLVAYNVLRLCGQAALEEDQHLPPEQKMPLAKPVFRRRLRSVIQDLMYLATRLTRHARRWGLGLWQGNPWRFVWQRFYHRFARPPGIPPAHA